MQYWSSEDKPSVASSLMGDYCWRYWFRLISNSETCWRVEFPRDLGFAGDQPSRAVLVSSDSVLLSALIPGVSGLEESAALLQSGSSEVVLGAVGTSFYQCLTSGGDLAHD